MSAKPSKKGGQKPATPAPTAQPVTPAAAQIPAPAPSGRAAVASAEPQVAWMDSNDPTKRMIGKIVFVGLWIYVAALCLLALDQTFHWGIFGPKVPPVP